jgi:hypothetical protein
VRGRAEGTPRTRVSSLEDRASRHSSNERSIAWSPGRWADDMTCLYAVDYLWTAAGAPRSSSDVSAFMRSVPLP